MIYPLIHPENTTAWKRGDIVIHDCDAKRVDMLMVITSVNRKGEYRSRYLFQHMHKYFERTLWKNTLHHLHDPARFGISAPQLPNGWCPSKTFLKLAEAAGAHST